ncbi:helix-turn-helix transcriptional regulator [Silvimonas soli]|uniref:helix-turn-helix transcriptional regulator n=1 Tax=Silvimonas soli TaxID=2980100 RepID=UPI0024B39C7C|nr:AlpA family phage regulatory protein [Silvimonas soli]
MAQQTTSTANRASNARFHEQYGALPVTGYVRQAQLIPAILPFSASSLWRMVRGGKFPAPVKLSERVTAWRAEDVRAWIDSRLAA